MRVVWLLVELAAILFFGINYGVDHGGTTVGGKALLAILAMAVIFVAFLIFDTLVGLAFGRPSYRSREYVGKPVPRTYSGTPEDAIASVRQRREDKEAGLRQGQTPQEIDAAEAERRKQAADQQTGAFWERVRGTPPLPPSGE